MSVSSDWNADPESRAFPSCSPPLSLVQRYVPGAWNSVRCTGEAPLERKEGGKVGRKEGGRETEIREEERKKEGREK